MLSAAHVNAFRNCAIFCDASTMANVVDRATRFTRMELIDRCASPIAASVIRLDATRTSMSEKPRSTADRDATPAPRGTAMIFEQITRRADEHCQHCNAPRVPSDQF